MGGMAQVVQTEVDKLLAADPEQRQAQLDTLHDAFIPWLATINPDNDQPMRRLARWDDLPAASHPLIQADGGEAAAGQRHPRRPNRGRGRAGKPAAAMARTGRLAARRSPGPQGRRQPRARRRRLAAPAGATNPGCWKAPGWPRPKPWPPNPASATASTPPATSCTPPGRAKTTASRPRSNASKPNCKPPSEHAAALRKRSRILRAVLAVTAVIAVVAVAALVQANQPGRQVTLLPEATARGWSPRPRRCWPVPVRR